MNGKSMAPIFVLLGCLLLGVARPARALDNPSFLYSRNALPRNFVVDVNFSSRLPILVFHVEGDKLPPADEDIQARLQVYCAPDGNNSLGNAPTVTLHVNGRPVPAEAAAYADRPRTGASASSRARRESSRTVSEEKRSYMLDLIQTDGIPSTSGVALAGLPADTSWFLHGSMRDKGMLRSALAYEFGKTLFPDATPAAGFCEVLFLLNGAYHYWGIHILGQNAEKLNIELAAAQPNPLLLKHLEAGRVRGDEQLVRAGSRLFQVVPIGPEDVELSQSRRRRIGVELEKVESALQSVSPNGFLSYQSYLDEKSAIDFFILSTLMLNAFDRTPAFYLRWSDGGKFSFIPDWRFELSLDNAPNRDKPLPIEKEMFEIEARSPLARRQLVWRILESGGEITDLRIAPALEAFDANQFVWIDRLFMSRSFVEGVRARFNSLRWTVFSPESILALVNDLSARLDRAIERDWVRWRKEYAATFGPYALSPFIDEEGVERIRQTWSHDQELIKISQCLGAQDELLLGGFTELSWMSGELFDEVARGTKQGLYAFGMLAGLFLLSYTFTRRL